MRPSDLRINPIFPRPFTSKSPGLAFLTLNMYPSFPSLLEVSRPKPAVLRRLEVCRLQLYLMFAQLALPMITQLYCNLLRFGGINGHSVVCSECSITFSTASFRLQRARSKSWRISLPLTSNTYLSSYARRASMSPQDL